MNCKNCNSKLSVDSKFCANCGAKVVAQRITLKTMLAQFSEVAFGWDNKYFFTIRSLIIRPQTLLAEYVNGTRKKYVNPFSFFAIGTALAILIFNQFTDQYLQLSENINKAQIEYLEERVKEKALEESRNANSVIGKSEETANKKARSFRTDQLEWGNRVQKYILKYFNVFSFFLLPVYALIAFMVYGKPYNYGEHLVINAYIQGLLFLSTICFFLISVFTTPLIYSISMGVGLFFYAYVYGKLYRLSFGRTLLKILKFLLIALVGFFVLIIIGAVMGLIIKWLG